MSHHFDYTADERLDISDAYCFAGPSDAFGPRTVFGMNASPSVGTPWDPAGYYELKLDTNEDLVEDITWRFTFPVDSAGIQHVVVAELTGREATDRNAKGRIITPPNAPVGEVLEVERGLKIFAGPRTDSFFNFIPFPVAVAAALKAGTFPDLAALFPPTDTFLNNNNSGGAIHMDLASQPTITGMTAANFTNNQVNGVAVELASVVMFTIWPPLVACAASPKVKAVLPVPASDQFHTCA